MTRSLTIKLTLAFLLVSLTGTTLVAFFAGQFTATEFDRYVLEQAQNDFIAEMSAYYQTYGSWTGVAEYLRRQRPGTQPTLPDGRPGVPQPPPEQPPPAAQPAPLPPLGQPPPAVQPALPPPPEQLPHPNFSLVDENGYVVVPAEPYRIGQRVPAAELERGTPIEIEGQVVGTVITIVGPPPVRDPREELYLERTNQVLLGATLGATGIALVLGIFLARTLTRPLRELTTATRAMAEGELGQQVPVRSQDELGELAASFNRMSADLARANELRRQMTADIAHDLRTPLSVIKGYAEALRDGALPPTSDTFQTMHKEAEHLSLLVEDLRTLSLADAGELTLTRQLVHPRELLERTASAHSPHARRLEISLQVTAEANLPPVNVDPERMAQVLGNLVSNALRYTPAGGQISLTATQQEDTVLLTVQDNGVGIAPDMLPRIFDRFYRGDDARQVPEGESGLGLAIAKSIVELHGGTITVKSSLGEGTTLTIAVPIADKTAL